MKFNLFIPIILMMLALTSCATINIPQTQTPQNQTLSWNERTKTLSSIQHWHIQGAVALQQAKNGGTANLQWQQQNQSFHIMLFGPLGSGSVELSGRPGQVRLATADGKHATANSPEALLMQQLGWNLPVSNLRFWVRGLPVPGLDHTKTLDNFNHLIELHQAGWIITYPRYTSVRQIDLPDKIFLRYPGLSVKIAISRWSV